MNYIVNGYKMTKNENTWEMERSCMVINQTISSILTEVDTDEDRGFLEIEISHELKCDDFELLSYMPK